MRTIMMVTYKKRQTNDFVVCKIEQVKKYFIFKRGLLKICESAAAGLSFWKTFVFVVVNKLPLNSVPETE